MSLSQINNEISKPQFLPQLRLTPVSLIYRILIMNCAFLQQKANRENSSDVKN